MGLQPQPRPPKSSQEIMLVVMIKMVVRIIIVGVQVSSTSAQAVESPLAARADKLSSVLHLQIRAREILTEQLALEGVSSRAIADADALATHLCSGNTADVVMSSIQKVLPADSFRELLAFCNREYPILYSTLPSGITGKASSFSWSQYRCIWRPWVH